MLIVTYGVRCYKIKLSPQEWDDLKNFCKRLDIDHCKAIQFMLKYTLRHFLSTW